MFTISSPPFVSEGDTVAKEMWRVNLALLPALLWGIWSFGPPALWVTLACVAACVATEAVIQKLRGIGVTVGDGSAVVTGVLLAFNVPAGLPLWMAVLGGVVAIAVAKQAFGGLGHNIFNPALIGRAFLLACFPVAMTTWPLYGARDGLTGATPLGIMKGHPSAPLPSTLDMLLGRCGGCIGETSAILLVAGGIFLLIYRDITWHTPVAFLGSLAIVSVLTGRAPLYSILAGGAMLGAIFMATDMVTAPVSGRGRLIFGAGCGIITGVIRAWGGYPEGVCYSILLMNAFTPIIDRHSQPRWMGAGRGVSAY